jgi:transglutaminase-like putative cysteine protease
VTERDVGRWSWADDGRGVPAPLPTWIAGVSSCAVALVAGIDDPATAAGAVLVLAVGAIVGRLARIDQLLRSTGAWMWSIGAGTVAFLALGWSSVATAGLATGLFLLPLDWRVLPRLRASVGAGVVFATLAAAGPGPTRGALFLLWAPPAALTLLLIEQDLRRIGRQADPSGSGRPRRAGAAIRSARDGVTLTAVAVASVLIALVVLPPPSPSPSPGRNGQGGESDPRYWGFVGDLDTATRTTRSDEVVLRVRSDTPALWRGDSFDRFDGRRWTHGPGTRTQTVIGTDRLVLPEPSDPGAAPGARANLTDAPVRTEDQVQVFTFERGGNDLVFGANRARVVLPPDPRPGAEPGTGTWATWAVEADSLRLGRPMGRGGSYTVISTRPRVDEGLLRRLDRAQTEAVHPGRAVPERGGRHRGRPASPFDRYLEVPESTSTRTRELAVEVTAGARTTIDRLRALEAWLGDHTEYRLDVPPLGPGRDTVDQFLFEDRQGYCEQIASALAVLLRVLGVPTRLAVGFVPDHQDPASGEWIVRERNAHAWVEVWWPGVGWQGFDPTASVPLAPDEGAPSTSDRLAAIGPPGLGLVAVVAVAGVTVLIGSRLSRRRRPRTWIESAVVRLERIGAHAGRPRRPDETLIEYGEALEQSVLEGAPTSELGQLLSSVAFGPARPAPPGQPDDGRDSIERSLAALAAGQRHRRRRTRSDRPTRQRR